jgi:hypothetical protein
MCGVTHDGTRSEIGTPNAIATPTARATGAAYGAQVILIPLEHP